MPLGRLPPAQTPSHKQTTPAQSGCMGSYHGPLAAHHCTPAVLGSFIQVNPNSLVFAEGYDRYPKLCSPHGTLCTSQNIQTRPSRLVLLHQINNTYQKLELFRLCMSHVFILLVFLNSFSPSSLQMYCLIHLKVQRVFFFKKMFFFASICCSVFLCVCPCPCKYD